MLAAYTAGHAPGRPHHHAAHTGAYRRAYVAAVRRHRQMSPAPSSQLIRRIVKSHGMAGAIAGQPAMSCSA